MRKNRGFTLIELMVVILIVAILAAVLAPMLSGRINEAKWTEGKAGAGTIATAIRAYCAEHEAAPTLTPPDFTPIGIRTGDLTGKYFLPTNYTFTTAPTYDPATGICTYVISVSAPTGLTGTVTLNAAGVMTGPQ
jgi:prepilin-type N-terminal cleavage/methylation domain-containing protein